jgi:hypothetical protein
MATTENITTTYAGESSRRFISAALLEGSSINGGGVTVLPNVKFQHVLHKLEVASLAADATCDFTDTGTLTLTERILAPKRLQINAILCKENYVDTWQALEMGFSAHDNLPSSFADYLVSLIVAQQAELNEVTLWSGATGTSGEWDGFETLMTSQAAQPAAQEVSGTTVTASNVVAEIQKVLDVIPSSVYSKEDCYIYIPVNIAKHYIAAQAALGYMDKFNVDKTVLNFQGVKLFVANGMTDDVMIATNASNLYFGTGLMSDFNEVKLIDTADTLGDQNVRIVMRYTAGCQIGNPEDVVTYGITNSGN